MYLRIAYPYDSPLQSAKIRKFAGILKSDFNPILIHKCNVTKRTRLVTFVKFCNYLPFYVNILQRVYIINISKSYTLLICSLILYKSAFYIIYLKL